MKPSILDRWDHPNSNAAPYVIAEIGVNHAGNIDLACQLVREAAQAGAQAAKFQSYKAEKIACRESPAYWDVSKEPTPSQFQLFKKYDAFGEADYQTLARVCASVDIDFLSTPFDLEAADLAPLMPAFKIASADITNLPLLRRCAAKGKPVLLSTGASSLPEIEFAVSALRRAGAEKIALLHCVLNYPTPVDHAQLGMIAVLRRVFPDCVIGYSDHVVPEDTMMSMELACMMGAAILEKHFTHDKRLPGNDHYHAMDAGDLGRFTLRCQVYSALRGGNSKNLEFEQAARLHARRSIVAARNILQGEVLSDQNLMAKRPAHGISPVHWDEVVGKVAACAIAEDSPLQWPMVTTGLGPEGAGKGANP
jgi:N-acetylneuraminate synthase